MDYTHFLFVTNFSFYHHTYVEQFCYIVYKFYVDTLFVRVYIPNILIVCIIFS